MDPENFIVDENAYTGATIQYIQPAPMTFEELVTQITYLRERGQMAADFVVHETLMNEIKSLRDRIAALEGKV